MTIDHEHTVDDAAITWCIRLDEGPLHPDEREDMCAWLARDPAHRERMDTAVAVWDEIDADASAPDMLLLRQQALAALQQAQEPRPTAVRRWQGQWQWMAVAAILMVAIGLTILLHDSSKRYATRIGEQRTVALNDGSTMVLDADSAVTVNFTGERRTLTLERGRASFKVAKNPLRPFAVSSGPNMVVATGTAFSVEQLAGEMRVTLFEGHVAILRDAPGGRVIQSVGMGKARETAEQALTPGHELIVPDGQSPAALRVAAVGDATGGGQLSFTNEPLGIAVERVNRYNMGKPIEVAPGAADIRVSGVFNAGDADAFARAVAAAFPVRVATTENRTMLVSRSNP